MLLKKIPLLLATILLTTSLPIQAAKTSSSTTLSTTEKADLLFMREEEKVARDVYLTMYDTWQVTVFSNIASSEQKHMDAILSLLTKYKLSDPAAGNLIGQFTNTELQDLYTALIAMGNQSKLSALQVGALIEETDIEDIVIAIEHSDNPDIDKVYNNLMCGSRNHLRAFVGNIENLTGQSYQAQVLDQEEVDAIVESPMETCG